jgi:phage terminase large subunit-like protein
MSNKAKRIAFVAPTSATARDVMIEGESGLLNVFPPHLRPTYIPSKRLIQFKNGAVGFTYSAEEPEQLRGPQHDFAWCDELCAWQYPETFDMLKFGLRLGDNPRVIITTTPKPIKIIKDILKDDTTHVTRGSTKENKDNLASTFLKTVVAKYEGTRLGRQELDAEILDDNPGALWQRDAIDSNRLNADEYQKIKSTFVRIVVAIDPATTSSDTSDETGIVVAAVNDKELAYVLADESGRYTPSEWAKKALELYDLYNADRIVAETNQGGDMIEQTLRTYNKNVSYKSVRASKGKFSRAEPVAALYEQRKVYHIGNLSKLEDQMCDYDPSTAKKSPDRMDALVWALTDLMLNKSVGQGYFDHYRSKMIKST